MSIKKHNKLTNQEQAYEILGYTEEAKKDKDWIVRLQAYRALGYTEKALNDKNYHIRQEAKIYLDFIKLNKI